LTLLEIVAALVILALAAAATMGAASTLGRGHQQLAAIAAVESMIGRARLIAVNAGGAWIELGAAVVVEPADESMPHAVGALPRGWSARLVPEPGGGPAEDGLELDAWGRSADAVIELSGPRGAAVRLRLLGLSGQILRLPLTGGEAA
jgi:type II secretory pathway pseudopilin PulG